MNRNQKYKRRRLRRALHALKAPLMAAKHSDKWGYRDYAEAYNKLAAFIPGEPKIPVRYW